MKMTPEFYSGLVQDLPYFRKTKWMKMLQAMASEWMWDKIETSLAHDPWAAFTGEDLRQPLSWDRSRYDNRLNKHFDTIVEARKLEKLRDVVKWLNQEDLSVETGVRVVKILDFSDQDQQHEFFWNKPKQNSWTILSATRVVAVALPILDFSADKQSFADVEEHRPHDVVAAASSAVSYQLLQVWEKAKSVAPELEDLKGKALEKEVSAFLSSLFSQLFGVVTPQIQYVRNRFEWHLEVEIETTYGVPNKAVYTRQWQQHYLTPLGTEEEDKTNVVGTVAIGPRALRHISNEVLARFAAQVWQLTKELDARVEVKALKALARQRRGLQSIMQRPEVKEFMSSTSGRDFSVQDLIDYSMTVPTPEKARKCSELRLGSDIHINYDEWTWPYQRAVTSGKGTRHPVKNYVLRLDWVSADNYLSKEKIVSLQQDMRAKTYHPNTTQGQTLTLGWVRYSIWKQQDAVVMDEIQTDLGAVLRELGLSGWAEKVGWYFLAFAFQHLRHDHILIPDLKTKLNVYGSRLPEAMGAQLYEKLPPRLGASGKVTLKVKGVPADFWLIPNPSRHENKKG